MVRSALIAYSRGMVRSAGKPRAASSINQVMMTNGSVSTGSPVGASNAQSPAHMQVVKIAPRTA
jgi:hypothetical protein